MKGKDNFRRLIREINSTFISIILFSTLLTSIVIFLLIYLPLSIFNFYPLYAFFPAVIYFFFMSARNIRKRHIIYLEKKYHLLEERLRTAEDNIEDFNPVVGQLKDDILSDIKFVSVSAFFNDRKVSRDIFLIIVLCFLIVGSSNIDFSYDLSRIADAAPNFRDWFGDGNSGDGPSSGTAPGKSSPSFGDPEISNMGEEQLDFVVRSSAYKINLRELNEPDKTEFEELFPNEVYARSPESFRESINEEHQELVKAYFLNLAKQ